LEARATVFELSACSLSTSVEVCQCRFPWAFLAPKDLSLFATVRSRWRQIRRQELYWQTRVDTTWDTWFRNSDRPIHRRRLTSSSTLLCKVSSRVVFVMVRQYLSALGSALIGRLLSKSRESRLTTISCTPWSHVGEQVILVAGCQTVHGFKNVGNDRVDIICIHASPRIIQTWLEE
jgi:hypothetical protein